MNKCILLLIISLLFIMQTNANNTINISPGFKTHLLSKLFNVVKQNVNAQELDINANISFDIEVAENATPYDIVFTQLIKRIHLKSESKEYTRVYDSVKKLDKENQVDQLLSVTFDKPLFFRIFKFGVPITNKEPSYDTEAIKNMLRDLNELSLEFFVSLPNNFKVGYPWSVVLKNDIINNTKSDYTLKSIANEKAVLTFYGFINKKIFKFIQGIEAIDISNTSNIGELIVKDKSVLIIGKYSKLFSKALSI